MSKTIEEIKAEVAKEYIKSGERSTIEQLMTEVVERYAQSQTQELIEQNTELVERNESLTSKLKDAKSMLGRLRRSMSAHPDCTSGSEFDDYTTDAQNLEDEIDELLTKNHMS